MNLIEARDLILSRKKVCDHCLGRQFRNRYKNRLNQDIGAAARAAKTDADFDKTGRKPKLLKTCVFCGGIFAEMEKYSKMLKIEAKKHDFNTFLMGGKIDRKLIDSEEKLWEDIGTEFCEPLKRELNRTFGILVSEWTGKEAEFANPDVNFIIDFRKGRVETKLNSLYIYGKYKKLVRGIPQTKWPCRECGGRGCKKCGNTGRQYKETVEELVAEKAIKEAGAKGSKFHGEGREDIDARMLGGGRPFVLELVGPQKRSLDLKKLERDINKFAKGKVEISGLRHSDMKEVQLLKQSTHEKTYAVLVECKNVKQEDLKKLEEYFHARTISQKTPTRVLHRRADKVRKRKILSAKCKLLKDKFRAETVTEAGAYVKELVSGDGGRTEPSFASVIKKPCKVLELDVIGIEG